MKGTDHFKELIKNYLDNRAKEDELFRAKYETTTRTIDDVVNYYLPCRTAIRLLRFQRHGGLCHGCSCDR